MELAEFGVLLGPPTLPRPRSLRETSPQLRRFLILGRGLYGDVEAIHHGHGGQQGRSQRRFGMLVVQHPAWDHGCGCDRGARDLRAVYRTRPAAADRAGPGGTRGRWVVAD